MAVFQNEAEIRKHVRDNAFLILWPDVVRHFGSGLTRKREREESFAFA